MFKRCMGCTVLYYEVFAYMGCRGQSVLEDWVQHLDFLIARLDNIHFYRDNIYFFIIFSSFVWWGEAKGDKTENNIICFIVVDPR